MRLVIGGQPIPYARITASGTNFQGISYTDTDKFGNYTLQLPKNGKAMIGVTLGEANSSAFGPLKAENLEKDLEIVPSDMLDQYIDSKIEFEEENKKHINQQQLLHEKILKENRKIYKTKLEKISLKGEISKIDIELEKLNLARIFKNCLSNNEQQTEKCLNKKKINLLRKIMH